MTRTAPSHRTVEHGVPGAYASTLARRALAGSAAASLAAVAAAVAAAATVSASDTFTWVSGVLVVLMLIAGSVARRFWARMERAFVGVRSEREVAAVIRGAGPDVVVHGALIGSGGDCDHAVLGPVVAVVETKTGSGEVSLTRDGLRAGRRVIAGDPIAQARRQAAALGKHSRLWAEAVVCVTGMTNAAFTVDGVTVCSSAELPAVLGRMPRICTPDAASRIAAAIAHPR